MVGLPYESKSDCRIGTGKRRVDTKGGAGEMVTIGGSGVTFGDSGVTNGGSGVTIGGSGVTVANGDSLCSGCVSPSILGGSEVSTALHQPPHLPGCGVFVNSGFMESMCRRVLYF